MNKIRDNVEEGFVKRANIVFKAANLYKVKYSPYCAVESEVIDKVEDAFAIVVLAVEEDDIISDLNKRKEKLAKFNHGLNTIDGIIYERYERFYICDMLPGRETCFAPHVYISEESPLWSSYSFNAIDNYLHTIKCRCKKAKVIDIINTATGERITDGFEVRSNHDPTFRYEIGGIVRPCHIYDGRWQLDLRYSDPLTICGRGIHYFNHLWEAFAYGLLNHWKEDKVTVNANGKVCRKLERKDGRVFTADDPFWSIQTNEDLIQFEGVKTYAKREIMGDGDSAWVEPRGNIVYDNGESGED